MFEKIKLVLKVTIFIVSALSLAGAFVYTTTHGITGDGSREVGWVLGSWLACIVSGIALAAPKSFEDFFDPLR